VSERHDKWRRGLNKVNKGQTSRKTAEEEINFRKKSVIPDNKDKKQALKSG